ncbi:ABC transporter ATP-binding protein [Microbacterium sp. NC79]|uniref:ABC transporter ATP-binding protein n=1 Tax=Microbacterium sp. NC79 TaxID=2851009 RepID=UPI0020B85DD5|nr:ABC transporter ATP-binding protein [Microbacterium sp. NC79]
MVLSASLALLDVAALMLLAASLNAMIQGAAVPLPIIGPVPPDGYVWIILAVSLLIIVKSALSVVLQWTSTRRMATYELEIGDRLFDAYIKAPWAARLTRNTSELVRMADVGIANVTGGFLLPFMSLSTLVVTSVAIIVLLFVAQWSTALVTLIYLGIIGFVLYWGLAARTIRAGQVNRDYSFKVASLLTDMVGALKEITLRNKSAEVAAVVHSNRIFTAKARANLNFLASMPRFILDSALVGGFLLVGGFALFTSGPESAIAAVALFGVAGMRLVPALTGFQALVNQLTSNIPHVSAVIDDINSAQEYVENAEKIGHDPIVGNPRELVLSDVSYTYPNSSEAALRSVSATLPMGSRIGVAGTSGAGKSTLIDILLGLLSPSSGRIAFGEHQLEDVLSEWRSRVGYVPQDVSLFDGTVAQNVALTWGDDIDLDRVRDSLRRAQLLDVLEKRLGGLDARVGDRGMNLSGGQRQRLGLARALYSNPVILVLDEATSALDTKTEARVMDAIRELDDVTVVCVAHRLSTIRDSDEIWFMRDGQIQSRGTFDDVVATEPEFAQQAALAGLV